MADTVDEDKFEKVCMTLVSCLAEQVTKEGCLSLHKHLRSVVDTIKIPTNVTVSNELIDILQSLDNVIRLEPRSFCTVTTLLLRFPAGQTQIRLVHNIITTIRIYLDDDVGIETLSALSAGSINGGDVEFGRQYIFRRIAPMLLTLLADINCGLDLRRLCAVAVALISQEKNCTLEIARQFEKSFDPASSILNEDDVILRILILNLVRLLSRSGFEEHQFEVNARLRSSRPDSRWIGEAIEFLSKNDTGKSRQADISSPLLIKLSRLSFGKNTIRDVNGNILASSTGTLKFVLPARSGNSITILEVLASELTVAALKGKRTSKSIKIGFGGSKAYVASCGFAAPISEISLQVHDTADVSRLMSTIKTLNSTCTRLGNVKPASILRDSYLISAFKDHTALLGLQWIPHHSIKLVGDSEGKSVSGIFHTASIADSTQLHESRKDEVKSSEDAVTEPNPGPRSINKFVNASSIYVEDTQLCCKLPLAENRIQTDMEAASFTCDTDDVNMEEFIDYDPPSPPRRAEPNIPMPAREKPKNQQKKPTVQYTKPCSETQNAQSLAQLDKLEDSVATVKAPKKQDRTPGVANSDESDTAKHLNSEVDKSTVSPTFPPQLCFDSREIEANVRKPRFDLISPVENSCPTMPLGATLKKILVEAVDSERSAQEPTELKQGSLRNNKSTKSLLAQRSPLQRTPRGQSIATEACMRQDANIKSSHSFIRNDHTVSSRAAKGFLSRSRSTVLSRRVPSTVRTIGERNNFQISNRGALPNHGKDRNLEKILLEQRPNSKSEAVRPHKMKAPQAGILTPLSRPVIIHFNSNGAVNQGLRVGSGRSLEQSQRRTFIHGQILRRISKQDRKAEICSIKPRLGNLEPNMAPVQDIDVSDDAGSTFEDFASDTCNVATAGARPNNSKAAEPQTDIRPQVPPTKIYQGKEAPTRHIAQPPTPDDDPSSISSPEEHRPDCLKPDDSSSVISSPDSTRQQHKNHTHLSTLGHLKCSPPAPHVANKTVSIFEPNVNNSSHSMFLDLPAEVFKTDETKKVTESDLCGSRNEQETARNLDENDEGKKEHRSTTLKRPRLGSSTATQQPAKRPKITRCSPMSLEASTARNISTNKVQTNRSLATKYSAVSRPSVQIGRASRNLEDNDSSAQGGNLENPAPQQTPQSYSAILHQCVREDNLQATLMRPESFQSGDDIAFPQSVIKGVRSTVYSHPRGHTAEDGTFPKPDFYEIPGPFNIRLTGSEQSVAGVKDQLFIFLFGLVEDIKSRLSARKALVDEGIETLQQGGSVLLSEIAQNLEKQIDHRRRELKRRISLEDGVLTRAIRMINQGSGRKADICVEHGSLEKQLKQIDTRRNEMLSQLGSIIA